MTEDRYRRRAEQVMGVMARTRDVEDRRRLIDKAMRWHNCAMLARDQELQGPKSRLPGS